MTKGPADMVVVRIVLQIPPDEWVRGEIREMAVQLERGELPEVGKQNLSKALRGIAAGVSAEKIFGLGCSRGGQRKTQRHKWIAIDYWIRSQLGIRKNAAGVAFDWGENSPRTVSDISRRYRSMAESVIKKWRDGMNAEFQAAAKKQYNDPLEVYLEAVRAVRYEMETGETMPTPPKRPEQKIMLMVDWEERLTAPDALKETTSK